jgi:hypothetical protein
MLYSIYYATAGVSITDPLQSLSSIPEVLLKSAHLALGLAAPELFQLALLLLQTRLKRLCLFYAAEQNLSLLSISLQQLLYLRLQALHKTRNSA